MKNSKQVVTFKEVTQYGGLHIFATGIWDENIINDYGGKIPLTNSCVVSGDISSIIAHQSFYGTGHLHFFDKTTKLGIGILNVMPCGTIGHYCIGQVFNSQNELVPMHCYLNHIDPGNVNWEPMIQSFSRNLLQSGHSSITVTLEYTMWGSDGFSPSLPSTVHQILIG